MGAPVVDIAIVRGKTFEFSYRYAEPELVYAPIAAMLNAAPVRLSIPTHGIPDGWPVRVEGVRQPIELNSPDDEFFIATRVDQSTVELNAVRADQWRSYLGGGLVIFNRPFDLTGCAARMQVRDRVDGAVLLSLSSDPDAERDGDIQIDTALASITVRLSPAVTASIAWARGVYDLELVTPSGNVYPITAISKVSVGAEVTR